MDHLHFLWVSFLVVSMASPALAAEPTEIVPLESPTLFLFEDFEYTDPGNIPKSFTAKGSMEVVEDTAHDCKHGLRLVL